MSVAELKEMLIDQIKQSENEALLEDISRLIELQEDSKIVSTLTANQLSHIEEAEKQVRNGQLLTAEEADKDIDQWLNQ